MTRFFRNFDWWIIICVIILAAFSLAVINSVSPNLVLAQLIFFLLGLAVLLLFANIDYHLYANLWPLIYFISVVILLVTFLIGIESRGAIRWIEFGGFRLQFSELLKPFLVAGISASLVSLPPVKWQRMLIHLVLVALPAFLILRQPDLGSALVYLISFVAMIFIAGIPWWYLLAAALLVPLGLPLVYRVLKGYQRQRIISFLNPHTDPLGSSYNAIQSIIAVGSGMIFGKGMGHGTQSQLAFLPERHTDFAFASFAEEFGIVGVTILLLAYGVIFYRLLWLISHSRDRYATVLLTGLLFILVVQVVINIGMNIGLLPVTGITLPLVSYGGSSVLAVMVILGIAENVAKQAVEIG